MLRWAAENPCSLVGEFANGDFFRPLGEQASSVSKLTTLSPEVLIACI